MKLFERVSRLLVWCVALGVIAFSSLMLLASIAVMESPWIGVCMYGLLILLVMIVLEGADRMLSVSFHKWEIWLLMGFVFAVHWGFIRILPALGQQPMAVAFDARTALRCLEAGKICFLHDVRNQYWCNYEIVLSTLGVITGGGLVVGQLMNAFCCVCILWPMFVLAESIGGRRVARLTVLTMGLSPALIMYSKLLSGEFLSAALLFVAMCFCLKASRNAGENWRASVAMIALGGAALGLSNLFKTIAIIFIVAYILFVVAVMHNQHGCRAVCQALGAVLTLVLVCNMVYRVGQRAFVAVASEPRLLTAQEESSTLLYELVLGSNLETDGMFCGKLAREFLALKPERRWEFAKSRFVRDWKHYPRLMVRKFMLMHGSHNAPHGAVSNFFLAFRDAATMGRAYPPTWSGPLSDSGTMFFRVLFLLGTLGFVLSLRQSERVWLPGLFSFLIVLEFAVVEQLIEGHGRYKTSVYPFYFMAIPYCHFLVRHISGLLKGKLLVRAIPSCATACAESKGNDLQSQDAVLDAITLCKAPQGQSWDRWRIFGDWNLAPDLIVSLGGDCLAASQIKVRGLRPFSLPFDWCSSDGAPAIEKLAHQFEVGFSDFARKANMEPIPNVRFGYKDRLTGFSFIHHFRAEIMKAGEYERFDDVLQRRLARLRKAIEMSKSVLFLVSRTWKIDEKCLRTMDSVCSRLWPGKRFQYILVTYNSRPAEMRHDAKFGVIRLSRDRTGYDLREKVFEWSFLDGIRYDDAATQMHTTLREGLRTGEH